MIVSILLENPESRPDFEDQLEPANEQRNTFLLNCHNICRKMNKPLILDIQVNSELQSLWMTQELQSKSTQQLAWPDTFCCEFADLFTPWRCETLMTNLFPSELTVNSPSVKKQKVKLHCALFGPWLKHWLVSCFASIKRGETVIINCENILQLMTTLFLSKLRKNND